MVSDIPAEVILARLPDDRRRWVVELRDQLRELLGARLVDLRLFGSWVRGDVHEESDVDVLVLVDGLDTETLWAISDLAHYISPWLSLCTVDAERYHAPASRATGFYKELRKESVRL